MNFWPLLTFAAAAVTFATPSVAQVAPAAAPSGVTGMLLTNGQAAKTPPSPLSSLVEELDRNNPELKAARREVDMRVARVAPAGAPNPPIRMADAASRIIFTARAPLTGSLGLNPRFIFICPTS